MLLEDYSFHSWRWVEPEFQYGSRTLHPAVMELAQAAIQRLPISHESLHKSRVTLEHWSKLYLGPTFSLSTTGFQFLIQKALKLNPFTISVKERCFSSRC